MKIGFSSLVCPSWDLHTIVANAANLGFDGVELRGVRGELNLPLVPEVAGKPEDVRKLFSEHNVELVCLGSSVSFDSRNRTDVARQKATLTEYVELAAKLGCPFVRLFTGEVQRRDHLRAAQTRIAEALISVAPIALRHRVTLLIENGGDVPGSVASWFLVDAADSPAVGACWNQCIGMTAGERATTSLPRLGLRIGMMHMCDATFDERGLLQDYKPLGEGHVEVAHQIDLLKGMAYDRYLMFEWPKLWDASLPAPETILPGVAKFLRERIDAKQNVLTAYKGDKYPTRFATPTAAAG